jgi:drug/metabolite transporter (DMT)-like permease
MTNWLMFIALGLIWGSSFLLIKLSVLELGTFPLVAIRLVLASLGFIVFLLLSRKSIPHDRKTLIWMVVLGLTNTTLPFLLITWGETLISSGLAGVLNGTVPLFSMLFAHMFLHDDKIHFGKIIGLIAGFVGIVVLATRPAAAPGGAAAASASTNAIEGQLAILAAAVFYGFSAVFLRRNLRHVDSMVTAGGTLTVGAISMLILTPIIAALSGTPLPNLTQVSSTALISVIVLGVLNTFIAYILFFTLLRNWGASRSTMVTYAMPPISLGLGILFGSELFDPILFVAAALIIGGVLVANLWKPQLRPQRAAGLD